MTATEVEALIEDAESTLLAVARLLEARTPLARWPVELAAALARALCATGVAEAETWKVVSLRRHLFGPDGGAQELDAGALLPPSPLEQRRAERLRAGLTALTRYGAGKSLRVVGACGGGPGAGSVPGRG